MSKEELFDILGDIDDRHINGALMTGNKPRKFGWMQWTVSAACLCLAVGLGMFALFHLQDSEGGGFVQNNGNEGGGFSNGDFGGSRDCEILPVHREDFTPGLSEDAKAAFAGVPGVLKAYRLLNNSWFLAEDLTDFSQVLREDTFYIVPDFSEGIDGMPEDGAYSVYTLDEDGEAHRGMRFSKPHGIPKETAPSEFFWLSDEIIREDLAEVDYEDYIIAQSTRLYTVFVWARCDDGEDVFVTYPARPEFVGLENRRQYSLAEIQQILTEASGMTE